MEEFESNHIAGMEKLLQKAFELHKESIRGLSSNLVKTKSSYYKILDKCQQLQKQNEDLFLENKKLRASLASQQNSCPNCSKGMPGLSSTSPIIDNQLHSSPKYVEQSQGRLKTSPGIPSDDDCLDFGDNIDIGKRKLHRKRSKRSRYSEDVSPELKRARQSSPRNSTTDTEKETNYKRFTTSSQKITIDNEVRAEADRDVKLSDKVLVPDTCVADMFDSANNGGKNINDKRRNNKHGELDLGVIHNLSVLVVPETLAMDYIGDDSDEDLANNERGRKIGKDLSDIPECENEDTLKTNSDQNSTMEEGKDLDESVDLLTGERGKALEENKNPSVQGQEIPLSLQSFLDSPVHAKENRSSADKLTNEITANVSSAEKLLCENSDNDSEDDKIPCSHTFGKSKNRIRMDKKQRSSGVRNSCQNMSEVNALFETPLPKSAVKKHSQGLGENSEGGKPNKHSSLLSKNERKKQKVDEHAEIILRRSPRKHKNSLLFSPAKKSRKCLSKISPIKSDKIGTEIEAQKDVDHSSSGRKSKITESSLDHKEKLEENLEDPDETIAPEFCNNDSVFKDNQSMDCYTVMPLKDGHIDTSNQFQVKVAKDKHNKKKALDFMTRTSQTSKSPRTLDETLKSPSLLIDKGHGKARAEDCSKLGSPFISVSGSHNNSSVNSKSPSVVSGEKFREIVDDDVEIVDWMSKKSGKVRKSSCSQDSSSSSHSRSSSRSSQKKDKIRKSGNLYSFHFEPADSTNVNVQKLHQTTLTQGFFSPKKKNEGKEVAESVKSATKDDKIDPGSFKKPFSKSGKHSKNKKKTSDSVSDAHLDSKISREPVVMDDMSADSKNKARGTENLNGSLDPGAELSEWCNELESLPSLDADIENMNPNSELNDLTMENSFDCRPKKQEKDIAMVTVVRKRDERQKLQGHGCKQCVEYYKSAGRSDKEIKQHMCQCSRHRAQYVPPDTPPHFWSIGFIDTQECNSEPVKNKEQKEEADLPSHRRRRKLNKYFKAKNEMSCQEDSQEIV